MIRIVTVSLLLTRLAFRPLQVSSELCLGVWRHRPAIVLSVDRIEVRDRLRKRIDRVFPF